ncbi:Methylcytosine dioxygenase TET1 [Plecturocebus cupreus]
MISLGTLSSASAAAAEGPGVSQLGEVTPLPTLSASVTEPLINSGPPTGVTEPLTQTSRLPVLTSQDLASSAVEDERHSEAEEPHLVTLCHLLRRNGPTLMSICHSHKNLSKPQHCFELNEIKFGVKEAKNKKMKTSAEILDSS